MDIREFLYFSSFLQIEIFIFKNALITNTFLVCLKKKRGAGAGAAWKKSQEPEPVKISRLLSPARR